MAENRQKSMSELFRRAGLELSNKDRKRFLPMLEAYLASVERLHSVNLSSEEAAPVFRPEMTDD